jgi:hypothetical protein
MSTANEIIVYQPGTSNVATTSKDVSARNAPAIVKDAGGAAKFTWEELF